MAQRMQSGMDTWEGCIIVTGGALEPRKSFWYLLSFFWDEGVWRYATVKETRADISVRNQNGEQIKLDRLEASESRITLGVETAPDGNSEEEYKKLLAASKKWSAQIKRGRLTKHDAWHAMSSSTIWKTFEYPFPATTLSLEQCEKIMAGALTAGMKNSHICRHFPKDLIHGPASELGGGIPHRT
jgi:hypothetical protein